MNPVGIVSIAFGAVMVCGRGALLVAPAASLRWFNWMVATNGRMRLLGAGLVALGATMIWAGVREDSGLAHVLLVLGWGIAGLSSILLVLLPSVYRAMADRIVPSEPTGSLFGWRLRGLVGLIAGVLLIYFGVLAL